MRGWEGSKAASEMCRSCVLGAAGRVGVGKWRGRRNRTDNSPLEPISRQSGLFRQADQIPDKGLTFLGGIGCGERKMDTVLFLWIQLCAVLDSGKVPRVRAWAGGWCS